MFPQRGGCLCGDVRYRLVDDPLTVYACHCTDCQRQTGASFTLSMVVPREALILDRGRPETVSLKLEDGRLKNSSVCARCCTRLWGPSRVATLAVLEPGTLDDPSWVRPVGHIWTRSAQGWVRIPDDALQFPTRPAPEDALALVRAWKQRSAD